VQRSNIVGDALVGADPEASCDTWIVHRSAQPDARRRFFGLHSLDRGGEWSYEASPSCGPRGIRRTAQAPRAFVAPVHADFKDLIDFVRRRRRLAHRSRAGGVGWFG